MVRSAGGGDAARRLFRVLLDAYRLRGTQRRLLAHGSAEPGTWAVVEQDDDAIVVTLIEYGRRGQDALAGANAFMLFDMHFKRYHLERRSLRASTRCSGPTVTARSSKLQPMRPARKSRVFAQMTFDPASGNGSAGCPQ